MKSDQPEQSAGFLWIEEGEQRHGLVAEVAPLLPLQRTYSFAVPSEMESSVTIGRRVMVPLGRRGRLVQAFVVGVDHRVWDDTLRPIASVVDSASFLTAELVQLGRRIARHYVCSLGTTLKAMTPEAVRQERGLKTVRYVHSVRRLTDIVVSGARLSAKRRALLEIVEQASEPVEVHDLLRRSGASAAILKAVVTEGWAAMTQRKQAVDSDADASAAVLVEPDFALNEEQRSALERINQRIDAGGFSATLLFGVSGSGKTEVYVRAMRRVLASGRQAVLLVPEIVLTTQLVSRLASRFSGVAVNHSGLTETQRSRVWRKIASGEKSVVIGTRSAVFAPCPNLGLICVDEEQETSYKNLRAPRFHVRDTAILRAKLLGIPVILGSATPSLETWYHSEHHPSYERIIIRHRVRSRALPSIHIVDMRDEWVERQQAVVLSRPMQMGLSETLARGEQAMILMNRRGFAHRVYCPACFARVMCPNCHVGLVMHVSTGESICHYCRCRMSTPTTCPTVTCREKLIHAGLGTQRVEEELSTRFPRARIERVDSDTMTHRIHYQRVVDAFEAREIDVLVGTQMIAKGLDFPFVSFVGVVDADPTGLSVDFRADERLFQLITQVAGRAGRADAPGRVVVQTTCPELPSLRFALAHDYESFARGELSVRQSVGLPPFRRLARIVLTHAREETVRAEAQSLATRILDIMASSKLEGADVLGPNPCAIVRLRSRYRYDLVLRAAGAARLHRLLDALETYDALNTKAESTIIDVDPVALM